MKRKIKTFDELKEHLPKFSSSISGKNNEPINVVIVGDRRRLLGHFKEHKWFIADKLGALSLAKGLVGTIFNLPYQKGPISPSYVLGKHFYIGLQRPTSSNTFRRRHHMRLWRTPLKLNRKQVWAGTVSYDRSIGLSSSGIPTHHIAPTLAWEESFLAHSLGIARPRYLKIGHHMRGKISNGDTYEYDGRAIVIDLTHK